MMFPQLNNEQTRERKEKPKGEEEGRRGQHKSKREEQGFLMLLNVTIA